MEADKNPFPKFEIFNPLERIAKIGRFIGSRLMLCDDERPNTGAAAMLDQEIYGQLEFDYERNEP